MELSLLHFTWLDHEHHNCQQGSERLLKCVTGLHVLHEIGPMKITWVKKSVLYFTADCAQRVHSQDKTVATKWGQEFLFVLVNLTYARGLIWGTDVDELIPRETSCHVVLSEKQQNSSLFNFNSWNPKTGLLIKYLNCWWRSQLLMWRGKRSLKRSSLQKLGALTERDWNCGPERCF